MQFQVPQFIEIEDKIIGPFTGRQFAFLLGGFGGGFIDAMGGGGWGSIVLSTLIAGGRNARYALGSVKLSRFFIALFSSLTFLTLLDNLHWHSMLGLVIGSTLAAPIAVKLSHRISVKILMVAVGVIVICASFYTIFRNFNIL